MTSSAQSIGRWDHASITSESGARDRQSRQRGWRIDDVREPDSHARALMHHVMRKTYGYLPIADHLILRSGSCQFDHGTPARPAGRGRRQSVRRTNDSTLADGSRSSVRAVGSAADSSRSKRRFQRQCITRLHRCHERSEQMRDAVGVIADERTPARQHQIPSRCLREHSTHP